MDTSFKQLIVTFAEKEIPKIDPLVQVSGLMVPELGQRLESVNLFGGYATSIAAYDTPQGITYWFTLFPFQGCVQM